MKNNKFDRIRLGKRRIIRLAQKLGLGSNIENLSKETRISLSSTGNIQIKKRDDKKRFGKSTKKQNYGHFSGRCQKHLSARELKERIID